VADVRGTTSPSIPHTVRGSVAILNQGPPRCHLNPLFVGLISGSHRSAGVKSWPEGPPGEQRSALTVRPMG